MIVSRNSITNIALPYKLKYFIKDHSVKDGSINYSAIKNSSHYIETDERNIIRCPPPTH